MILAWGEQIIESIDRIARPVPMQKTLFRCGGHESLNGDLRTAISSLCQFTQFTRPKIARGVSSWPRSPERRSDVGDGSDRQGGTKTKTQGNGWMRAHFNPGSRECGITPRPKDGFVLFQMQERGDLRIFGQFDDADQPNTSQLPIKSSSTVCCGHASPAAYMPRAICGLALSS